jgi:hypothetical protein
MYVDMQGRVVREHAKRRGKGHRSLACQNFHLLPVSFDKHSLQTTDLGAYSIETKFAELVAYIDN